MSEDSPLKNRRRARVVVADDHSPVRDAIKEVLSSSFDVVAAVADGHEAVAAAHQLDPDVVVLDITMPVLDGFGAARELVTRGTRAKLLFLSVHDGDEYVAAAVATGVHGYVVKSRLATDLPDAVQHVLEGRLRLPTPSSLLGIADRRARHAVQFHSNDDVRLDELSRFAARALRRGDVVMAAGRPALLSGVASRLTDAGFDLTSLGERGRYRPFNAEEFLSRHMRGDALDEASLVDVVHQLEYDRVTPAERDSGGVVVFGEIAGLLLRDGNIRGALAIERIWHSHSSRFHTLCSYCSADLKGVEGREVFDQLCAVHHTVSP